MRLSDLRQRLLEGFGYTAIWGAELEFYLTPSPEDAALADVWQAAAQRACITLPWLERERGQGQVELAFPPLGDPAHLAWQLDTSRQAFIDAAPAYGLQADFAAKPFPNDYGSALHIHLHLENGLGENVFTKEEDVLSPELSDALGGMLALLPQQMEVFFPAGEKSRARLLPKMHAPTTVSWGGNNRTTALRLPDTRGKYRRIEHRVAGADTDPAAVMAAMLEGVIYGLEHHPAPGTQVHGDASDTQYGLAVL